MVAAEMMGSCGLASGHPQRGIELHPGMKAQPSALVGKARDHVHSPACFCVADTRPRVAKSSHPAPHGPRLTHRQAQNRDPPRVLLPL